MARLQTISKDEVRERAATARTHCELAELALPSPREYEASAGAQAAASNAILAGIAAADAICGHASGQRSSGPDHKEAVALLASVRPDGPTLSKKLSRLLANKTLLQYGGFCTRAVAAEMIGCAQDLIEGLDKRLPPAR